MERESIAELNALPKALQNQPEVLLVRLHHLMQRQEWVRALNLSRKLCRIAPECGAGFLHAAFCLNQLGKTAEARKLLLAGPSALLKEPIYYYNMGCYEALLGNAQNAHMHLKISFEMDASFRQIAKTDPDLRSIQSLL